MDQIEHSDLGPQGREHLEGLDAAAGKGESRKGREKVDGASPKGLELLEAFPPAGAGSPASQMLIACQSFPGRVPQDETW